MIPSTRKIFIAGHRGLVRQRHRARLATAYQGRRAVGHCHPRARAELDLLNGNGGMRAFLLARNGPAFVVVAAAKVGGIKANNDFPVDFLLDNLKIQNHLIEIGAPRSGVGKLLVSGQLVHLPEVRPAADHRRIRC